MRPSRDQIQQVQVRLRWLPESLGVGDDQVRTRFIRSKRATWGPESPGMVEAQVATLLTRSRSVQPAGQFHQIQVRA